MKGLSAISCISILIILPVVASQAGDLSTEEIEKQNKEIIRTAHASLQAGDIDRFKSLISPNYTRHCQAMPPGLQEIHGTEKFFGFIEEFIKAVPVYTDSLSNMIAEGDRVAYVSTMKGTMTGPMGGFPATGKSFILENIIIQRLEDGKFVETWISWDNVAFLTQLGLMPEPPAGSQ
jgi:predicted ester cyclase